MSVELPIVPAPWSASPQMLDFGITATPALGGATQRISRLGSRWRVTLSYPALTGQFAGAFRAALIKARSTGTTIRARWPIAGAARDFGKVLVNGGSQTGSSLICDGFVGGVVPAGTFFSYEVSSRSYVEMTTDDVIVTSGGATLSIAPMLRASPADNAVINFTPIIEGFLEGDSQDWTFERLAWEGFELAITEAQ